jgi:hypothetical protein
VPIDLACIPLPLIRAVETRNLVLFVGSGISRHASQGLPAWAGLVDEILSLARDVDWLSDEEEARLREMALHQKYPEVAQYLKRNTPGGVLDRYFQKRFTPEDIRPAPIHRALVKLRTPLIVTTNYDLLLEVAYAEVFGQAPEVITPDVAHKALRVLQDYQGSCDSLIFKIHGTALNPADIVIGESDYNQLLYSNPTYRQILETVFLTKVVLMVGSSFSDPDVVAVVSELRIKFPHSQPNYIILPKTKQQIDARRLRYLFGLEVMGYDPSNDRSELLELIEYLAQVSSQPSRLPEFRAT